MDCLRLAMWSGPRNISTAMMRAFENRADCAVVDEPLYAAYLDATSIDHPGREDILASQPRDWREVANALCTESPAPLYYQKHMTQHLLPDMDLDFTSQLRNCFLIRDPRRIIASYARVRPQFELEELGFVQQQRLFERECDRLGYAPPVLDAELTLADPAGVLQAFCDRLGIAFDSNMLRWPAGPRDSDGVWAPHWYAAVWQSTGFSAPDAAPNAATGLAVAQPSQLARPASGQAPDPAPDSALSPALSPAQERLNEAAQESYSLLRTYAITSKI
jgi:hypothetical protein